MQRSVSIMQSLLEFVIITCSFLYLFLTKTVNLGGLLFNSMSIQEVFHVYLNKCEIVVSHLFLIIFSNNIFTLVNLISRNGQSPRKKLLSLFAGLKKSLKMSSQSLSV